MSNHSFFAPSRSAFGALCQTSRSRQRAKSSRAAAVEPQLAPLCGRSLLVSFPLFTHCLSNTALLCNQSENHTCNRTRVGAIMWTNRRGITCSVSIVRGGCHEKQSTHIPQLACASAATLRESPAALTG